MIAADTASIRRLVQDATARFCAGADLRARYSSSSDLQDRIDAAASSTDTEPSPAEIEAGNYQKGKFWVWGLQVTIETPAGTTRSGTTRSGTDRNGKEWSHRLPYHYGYIRRTKSAADGDQVDVFIGPDPASEILFVVDQQTPGGRFDEHKVMLGWTNEREAKQAYLDSYTPGWQGFGGITAMTVPDFVEWLDKGDTGKRVAQYALAAAMVDEMVQQFETAMYGQLSLFKEDDHPRDAGGKFSTKTGGGKTVNFVPHPHASKEHETVMVDTEALDKAWKAGGLHIPPGGEEIAGRRAGVEKFLQTGKPVQAPKVYVQPNGSVVFGDGRHRFAVLRDSGAKQVAVTLDKGSAGKIGKGSATAEKPRPELVQAMNAAVQQHIAKQPSPPPAIEGMQKSLFGGGDLRTGQKSLFNVALPPKKPAKPAERPAAGGPAQINPLDQLVPQQEPSLPGQRSLYQQIHADFLRALYDFTNAPEHPPQSHTSHQPPRESSNEGKHAAGWKKVGGSSVHVNSNGTIDAGCPGLKGEEVEDLIDEPDESRERREHRQAQAESRGIKGHEVTAKQARALEGGERKQQAWQRMKELARQHGVSASRVMQHVGDVLQSHQEFHTERESGKKLAREMAGMTAGDAARFENSGRDWSSMPHFDEAADEFINNQPHLGIRDPQEFWDFIREGARPVPQAWHDSVMQEAAQRAAHSAEQARKGRPRSTAEVVGDAFDDWQYEKNGTSFDPSQFDLIPAGVDDDVPL